MKRPIVFDKLALDKGSVRSFDTDGRMRVKIANISKAQVSPYKGSEIPGWEELRLDPERIYQMLRDPDELKAAAPTFNGIQLLKKHVPVDADDHQMWDIVGTTGSEAAFDGLYLTNSLFVWTKEGIDLIESGDQEELSCGYHYIPVMVSGDFNGQHFDGRMTRIEGNHVALVEEGRAGHDVVVGDSAISEGKDEMKPTRLQYKVLMSTAAAINPLLALDAKVDYSPILKGLTTKNFAERKPKIVEGVKKAIAGKTIAKDASIEHLAKALDTFKPDEETAKDWDESVSENQHKAMEAAAHGESTLGIPKSVGEEFAEADKGKKFGDSIRAWAKDKGLELSDEDYSALDAMHSECKGMDEEPDDAMDGEVDEKEEDEGRKKAEAEDGESEEDKDEDKRDEKKPFGGKDKGAKDRQAKDKGKAMDKSITQDEVSKAIAAATAAERKRNQDANEARAFVRPLVGELSMALDSAESILRAAAGVLQIEGAADVHASALKPLIKMAADSKKRPAADPFFAGAMDGASDSKGFAEMFPDAMRIGTV